MVVNEIIIAHFGGHIGPLWKDPGNLEIPGNGAAAVDATAVIFIDVVDDVMVADSMIYYNDHYQSDFHLIMHIPKIQLGSIWTGGGHQTATTRWRQQQDILNSPNQVNTFLLSAPPYSQHTLLHLSI